MAECEIDIVFTGPPGPDPADCGFVEVEDLERRSVNVGEWVKRDDGYWALRLRVPFDSVRRAVRDGCRKRTERGEAA